MRSFFSSKRTLENEYLHLREIYYLLACYRDVEEGHREESFREAIGIFSVADTFKKLVPFEP